MGADSLYTEWDLDGLTSSPERPITPGAYARDPLTGPMGSDASSRTAYSVDIAADDHLTNFRPGQEELNNPSVFGASSPVEVEANGSVNEEQGLSQNRSLGLTLSSLGSGEVVREPINIEPSPLMPLIGLPDFPTGNF